MGHPGRGNQGTGSGLAGRPRPLSGGCRASPESWGRAAWGSGPRGRGLPGERGRDRGGGGSLGGGGRPGEGPVRGTDRGRRREGSSLPAGPGKPGPDLPGRRPLGAGAGIGRADARFSGAIPGPRGRPSARASRPPGPAGKPRGRGSQRGEALPIGTWSVPAAASSRRRARRFPRAAGPASAWAGLPRLSASSWAGLPGGPAPPQRLVQRRESRESGLDPAGLLIPCGQMHRWKKWGVHRVIRSITYSLVNSFF